MKHAGLYYLDHAAATPIDERVAGAMQPFYAQRFFNPSSPYAPAVAVRREYEAAKARLAATFGARSDELIMTAGATESINLAFASVAGHVVVSSIEHDAVLAAAKQKDHSLVPPTSKGIITPEAVAEMIRPDTQLVSVQLANNEIGTIQPVRQIAQVVKAERLRRGQEGSDTPLLLHCDASQGFGQIDVHTARLGVDLLTLNAAKMYGPKQVGLLWAKPGVEVVPQIIGGGQERALRSGTENVAGTVGFATAAELAAGHRKAEAARLGALRDEMERTLGTAFPEALVSGHPKKRLPGSLHISFPGLDAERLIFRLETRGVLLATGSACAANKNTRSHVLTAIGLDDAAADGSLRITLGRLSDEESCRQAALIMVEEIRQEYERTAHA
jgi:cysteine desulfurase